MLHCADLYCIALILHRTVLVCNCFLYVANLTINYLRDPASPFPFVALSVPRSVLDSLFAKTYVGSSVPDWNVCSSGARRFL